MFRSFGRSHRRMVIRSLKNRKAILDINQSRNGFPAEEEDEEYIECKRYFSKPNRNKSRLTKMDYASEVGGTLNSTGWKVSTRRKRQWKHSKPSCRYLNKAEEERELCADIYPEDEEEDCFEREEATTMTTENRDFCFVTDLLFLKEYGLSDEDINKIDERVRKDEYLYEGFVMDFSPHKTKDLFEMMNNVGFHNIRELVIEHPDILTWNILKFQKTLMAAYPHVLDYNDLMERLNADPEMLMWLEDDDGDGNIGVDFAGGRLNMLQAEIQSLQDEIDAANKTITEAQKTIDSNRETLNYLKWNLRVMENKRIYQALIGRDKTYSEVIDFICPKGDPSNSKLAEWF